jgi:4-amino-4-deoxy-L-arabinose transferase-like glycosyltransferase
VEKDNWPRALAPAERLFAALIDPTRRERTVILALAVYVSLWTIYGALAKATQDIHSDMSEQFALGQNLALGYSKHPPLAVLIVRAWFSIFPTTDWAYYLLAMTNAGVTLYLVWRLAGRFLEPQKCVLGLALLTFVPFFNFHALKFNANTVLLPLWAATTLAFLRSNETHRIIDAALAGLAAAAAMYGKYWSVFLLLGLALAALIDARRVAYFRSGAPWVTALVGLIAIAPHLIWLYANDFTPFSYAMFVHGASSFGSTLQADLGYLAGTVAYAAVPLLLVWMLARPSRMALADMVVPHQPQRRLAAAAFWAPLLLPAVIAPFTGIRLVSLWSMPALSLLPVVLLSSPNITIGRRDAVGVLALAAIFPLLMIAAAPAVALTAQRAGIAPSSAHSSALVEPVERLWRETTDRPLKLFAGYDDFTDAVVFYLPSHPLATHLLDRNDLHAFDSEIERNGIVLLCPRQAQLPGGAEGCRNAAEVIVARFPAGRRAEVEVARKYMGIAGPAAGYLIITIPPRS